MDNKKTGKVLDSLKSSRAKFHDGGHTARKGRYSTTYTPHEPHSEKELADYAERRKKAEPFIFDHKKEKLIDYARRNKLPLPEKKETHVNDIKAYFAKYGLEWNDRGRRDSGPGSSRKIPEYDEANRRNFADRMYALSVGEEVSPYASHLPQSRHGVSNKQRRKYEERKEANRLGVEKQKQLFADRQVTVDADAKKAEEAAAQKVVRDKEVADRKAAAEAAKAKKAADFKAAKEAEAAAFINPVTGLPEQTAGAPSGGEATLPESDANDSPPRALPVTSPVPGGETSRRENEDGTFSGQIGYPEQNRPDLMPGEETMPKKTEDTSTGSAGGITESASQAGSVTSLAPEGEAPTELAYTNPDAVVSKVAPALIDTEGTYTAEEDIIKLDSPEDITVEKVVAPTMDALAKQGEVTKITAPEELEAASYDAQTLDTEQSVTAAKGTVSDKAIAKADAATLTERAVTAERDTEAEAEAKAEVQDFNISEGSYVDKVTGEKAEVAPSPEIEARQREAILGEPADAGQATQIIDTVGYTASQMRTVKGKAAKGAAAEMIAEVGNIPEELSATIVENPVEVEAMLDDEPVEVRAAIAALPTEALVSTQMETLLAGMEEGETPMWARPALAAVERKLAARGMSRSTVGRDALFNSIITSALPMAQSNAEALQKRAAQNLDNEQQANLVRANLESQRRLKNVANRQTAASQTASNAQQMAALQSQFVQDTMIQSAAQQQQVRVENLRNQQQSAVENMRAKQQANMENLGNEQQMEALNLQMEFDTNKSNMDAENLEKLNEMKIAAEFLAKNAELKQQMDLANLNNDQQMRLANLTHLNNASSDNLNAAQKTDLANLNARLETNLTSAQIATQMNIAQLNADQQRAVENAKMVARVDLSKFDAKQQVELANSKFMQTMVQTEFNAEQQTMLQNATAMASMDVANADQRTKLAITNAQAFLQMDMTNLNNQQQANITKAQMNQQRLLSNQSQQNAAKQFNAQSEGQTAQFMASLSNQIQQYNSSSQQAREQFNVTETNKRAAQKAGNKLEVERLNAQLMADVTKFNAQQDFQRDQWNAANAQAIQQSNISWRRQANLANTAAQNAANGQNVQIAYNMTSQEQTQMWQQMRDDAAYIRQAYENDEQRKSQLVATVISSDEAFESSGGDIGKLITLADDVLDKEPNTNN